MRGLTATKIHLARNEQDALRGRQSDRRSLQHISNIYALMVGWSLGICGGAFLKKTVLSDRLRSTTSARKKPLMSPTLLFKDDLAEWSKALASGASPQGRGFEPHSRHLRSCDIEQGELRGTHCAWWPSSGGAMATPADAHCPTPVPQIT